MSAARNILKAAWVAVPLVGCVAWVVITYLDRVEEKEKTRAASQPSFFSEEHGFEIKHPGGRWKITPLRGEKGEVVSVAGPGSASYTVLVVPAESDDLHTMAQAAIDESEIIPPKGFRILPKLGELDGSPAIRFDVKGAHRKKYLEMHTTIVLHKGRAYHLVRTGKWAWADRLEDLFRFTD